MRTIVHMTTVAPVAPSTTDRRARLAVSALFLTNGALFMNLAPRWPEVQASLGLSNRPQHRDHQAVVHFDGKADVHRGRGNEAFAD